MDRVASVNLPQIKLSQGIHVMHLFYRINRKAWASLASGLTATVLQELEKLCAANSSASHPRLCTYANIGGKADLGFMLLAADLGAISQLHRDLESIFPHGTLERVYTYLSVTELTEYMTTEEEQRLHLTEREKLAPDSEEFRQKLEEFRKRMAEYAHYRLYPELPDWEIMCFYPMNKRRKSRDNWYTLDIVTRKGLMGGHARVGRKYSGRIVQLITGSTGLDDWEWGVTLVAHQADAIKEIVYEMRFDEVSARYGEFGTFYMNLRLSPAGVFQHLGL